MKGEAESVPHNWNNISGR